MWPRVATNPKPEETDGLLDFGIEFINKLPIQWSVIGTVVLLGAIYYGVRGSHIPVARPPPSARQPHAALVRPMTARRPRFRGPARVLAERARAVVRMRT